MKNIRENKKKAFTLAEVMITLVVIGIVAALTVPAMVGRQLDRVSSERHANIVYKLGEAMHLMKAHGELDRKFANTAAFVDRLEKYIKISRRCDSNNIDKCWPTKKVTARSGKIYEVKNAKTRKDILGGNANSPNNPNVGIVLDDGAHIILTYDPNDDGFTMTSSTQYIAGLLPVGDGVEEYKQYTNTAMRGIAFVFDVNGKKGPNKEQLEKVAGSYKDAKDIRGFNGAHFITDGDPLFDYCDKYETYSKKALANGRCYFQNGTANWGTSQSDNACPKGTNNHAKESRETLQTTCSTIKSATTKSGKTFPFTGWFWSSTGSSDGGAYDVNFDNCRYSQYGHGYGSGDKSHTYGILCSGT